MNAHDQGPPSSADAGYDTGDADGETYHGYSVDDETQPQSFGDSLADDRGLEEPLDEGYSPPERWSVGQGFGNTPLEEELGETLDMRLAQEEPEPDPYAAAEAADPWPEAGDPWPEAGGRRTGRLVAPDEGVRADEDQAATARDVGIDGAGASAEEAAMHTVDEDGL